MKVVSVFTALILALFANVVYSAAIDNSRSSRDLNSTETADFADFSDVIAYALPDGRRKIDFYSNGVLDGSAVETEDGATFFEADGTEIDLNETDEKLAKRVSKWRLAIKFAKLIKKYGKKAWNYIYCVGTSAMWRCGDESLIFSTTILPFEAARLLIMSRNMRMPGAWESDSDDSHLREPIPPLPTTTLNRNIPFPEAQGRQIPSPTTQRRRSTYPKLTKPTFEYEFFADISDDGNGKDSKKPIVIAVFGKTGTGKSSLIKTVTGKDVKVGHGLASRKAAYPKGREHRVEANYALIDTKEVTDVSCRIDNQNVILVDTPGFGDTTISDTEILRKIAEWMRDSYDDGFLLSGIIYLHRISDDRMEGQSLKNLRMMRKLCGTNSLKNVVLATTMWENVTESVGMERELELKQDFWKDMIEDGSTVARILTENGNEAHELVRLLLKNKPLSTLLQDELRSGKTLAQTGAGTEIIVELAQQEQRLRREYQAEHAEWERAMQSSAQKDAENIRKEMQVTMDEINKLKAQNKELENLTLPPLQRARRKGLFGMGSYLPIIFLSPRNSRKRKAEAQPVTGIHLY
ncbi:hypothetical protein V493_00350 [Pseudogymnoascus sp. VKM F-4281 (FW-2241)]|nr:hypothetical protein V493_00350 [Pseudogymnoascus sp. VKM F-4281 (FW-2241)]